MLDFRTAPSQKLILLHTNVCHGCCFVISCFILKVSLSSSVMSCYFLSLYFISRLICFAHPWLTSCVLSLCVYLLRWLLASFLSIPACCHISSAAMSCICFFSFFHYWFLFYFGFLLFSLLSRFLPCPVFSRHCDYPHRPCVFIKPVFSTSSSSPFVLIVPAFLLVLAFLVLFDPDFCSCLNPFCACLLHWLISCVPN